MSKSGLSLLGFLLFFLGFMSIVFSLVGLQFTFFNWMNIWGVGFALILKIALLFGGLIIVYIAKMPAEDID